MSEHAKKTVLEYIWIGGNNELRSKTKVHEFKYFTLKSVEDVPQWNYDGSSTDQAESHSNTEVVLVPRALFANPLEPGIYRHHLVLCDTYDIDGRPLNTNHRHAAAEIFQQRPELQPWFGLEQEYFMIHADAADASAATAASATAAVDVCKQTGRYYCGTQICNIERRIAREHLAACLDAKLIIAGVNAEVSKNQWEFQVGPCLGIESGDHLWVARFLLERIAEIYNVQISYTPKLRKGVNGSGCHANFSTLPMRENISAIYECLPKLEAAHSKHIAVYGKNNMLRLTGHHETSDIHTFSFGLGTRNTSVRIPNQVVKDGCGYFEDRRPAANIDPYQVTSILYETCCLGSSVVVEPLQEPLEQV